MNTADVTVRLAGTDDLNDVALLLAAAFEDGDYANWLVPDKVARHLMYPPYFTLLLEPAIEHGQIELTSDGAAAAVWYRLCGPPPAPTDYEQRLTDICGARTAWFKRLDAALERHHPRDTSHDYLAFLAVRPGRQRQGRGSQLLKHHHTLVDAAGLPCYLEATGPANADLYERHGYHRHEPFPLASSGPSAHPMMRPAAPVVALPAADSSTSSRPV
ncbi:GNAT family N-acetyltransferase [Actinoplanes teichomyceticus]|uniref:Acetyltransferase (GNAT) family protein n=1 Tax=Actinoplanes teichomyceticus TaxID=1867 RepID=A0A561VS95_ACTTI|nr:GNAT family N-acetyltransferase [Actinoplanes teichomyceticus]TWG14497.1 acetyltransferase (GNAT) family protein [Actinoplanes teichomyceticus]GIF16302.1 hypothetical protein Ate01nite_63340 [Actinoplanes teichomyceticus]